MSLTVAPLTTAVMTSIRDERFAGVASGINNAIARVAGLLAVALFGAVMVIVFARDLERRLTAAGVSQQARSEMGRQSLRLAQAQVPANASERERKIIHTAVAWSFVRAFRVCIIASAALAILSAVGALFVTRPSSPARPPALH
jgi:sugar/nucleoside kinase (ribokinase family)